MTIYGDVNEHQKSQNAYTYLFFPTPRPNKKHRSTNSISSVLNYLTHLWYNLKKAQVQLHDSFTLEHF